ncbi:hypothetical protein BHE74_00023652, partial [Ensete ventricosum]
VAPRGETLHLLAQEKKRPRSRMTHGRRSHAGDPWATMVHRRPTGDDGAQATRGQR